MKTEKKEKDIEYSSETDFGCYSLIPEEMKNEGLEGK